MIIVSIKDIFAGINLIQMLSRLILPISVSFNITNLLISIDEHEKELKEINEEIEKLIDLYGDSVQKNETFIDLINKKIELNCNRVNLSETNIELSKEDREKLKPFCIFKADD